MKKIVASALAAASVFSLSPAFAEPFQGPFIGAHAGWNEDRVRGAHTDVGDLNVREAGDKFFGGIFAGYDLKVAPRIVIGAEAGFDMAVDDRIGGAAGYIDPNYSFDVTARAGYLVSPKTLLFVRGGYENTRARVSNGITEGHDTFDGWTVGGGVEREIMDHVSASLEYRYADLGSHGNTFDRHQALVGVAYHF